MKKILSFMERLIVVFPHNLKINIHAYCSNRNIVHIKSKLASVKASLEFQLVNHHVNGGPTYDR